MPSVNTVIVAGNLTRDLELRYTPSGTAVTDLGIAVNEYGKGGKESTLFVDCTVWDKQAENCCEYLRKGDPVLVQGKLVLDQWESNQGEKRSKIKITAFNVQFLRSKKDSEDDGSSGPPERSERRQAQPEGDDVPF